MSYQAQAYVRDIRGVTRGEKALLMALGYYHDSRNNSCRASYAELATDCEITERHAIRLIGSLTDRNVISVAPNNVGGRGKKTAFQFLGMPMKAAQKGDIRDTQRVTSEASENVERVTFEAQKGDIRDTVIRKEVNQVEMMIKGNTSSSADDGRSLAHINRVIELFELSPVTSGKANSFDRETAKELLSRFTVDEIEGGIFLGSGRRMGSPSTVRSLAYFTGPIEEWSANADGSYTDSYRDYLERKLSPHKKPSQAVSA